jgi:hypothetical protein
MAVMRAPALVLPGLLQDRAPGGHRQAAPAAHLKQRQPVEPLAARLTLIGVF